MPEADFKLHIQGPEAEVAARELSAFFQEEFACAANRISQPNTQGFSGSPERADPIAVTALVLAIPSAILASVHLADRIKKKEKIQRLIEWTKNKRKKSSKLSFHFSTPLT